MKKQWLCIEKIYEARPELLYGSEPAFEENKGWFTLKKTLVVLFALTVLIGGGLSLFASSNPDGLEWSIERITGSTELEAAGGIYQAAGSIQEATALLPDYAFKGSESALGTTFSGVAGGLLVIAVCIGACYAFKFFRKRRV